MKISVYIATSLDGFIARENGDLDWLPGANGTTDPQMGNEDYGYRDFINSVDAIVMVRKTYEKVLAFGKWPYSKQVIILSNSLSKIPASLNGKVRIKSGSVPGIVAELEQEGIRHIYIDGGKTIQAFLNAGLINEITITKIPVLIGTGIPLFGSLDHDINLIHKNTCAFKNGFVQSTYEVNKGE